MWKWGLMLTNRSYRATKAFISHDEALADQVLDLDRQINDQEVTLEKQALKLMALQQPLANDFHLIISILKRLGKNYVFLAQNKENPNYNS